MKRKDALRIAGIHIGRQCGSMQAAIRALVPELRKEGENVPVTGGWVARDRDGFLSLFLSRPVSDRHGWRSAVGQKELDRNLFPDVKWEDEEPVEVELTITRR